MAQWTPQLHAGRSGSRLVPGIHGQVQTDLIETGSRGTWPGQSRPLFFGKAAKKPRYFAGFQAFEICRAMAKKLVSEG
jgi:hypothetical protein